FYSCYSLASITIPDGVESIGNSAFAYCYSLASITLPEGVTSIGIRAFYSCYSLASITIPDGVTSIDSHAFAYCCSLASITLPDSVESIGDMAFYTCYSCKEYIFTRLTSPTLGTNVFTNITSANRIFVPDESLDDYKTAPNWASWEDYIYPISAREN
ncbi:MAG: leucine-rich repeat domain-containing protein, partial [Candidatus Riflebacteria bacterium]|nr:leucine-rich repeat domain-containing protein [Candidatus Riflebacteria bacterium]